MFDKLKMLGLIAIGIVFLISFVASIVGTYRVGSALEDLNNEKIKIAEEGASRSAIAELTSRVEQAESVSKESLGKISNLKEEVAKKNSTVYITTVTESPAPNGRVVNEIINGSEEDDTDIALRAINELWVDFCKKFPSEPRCRSR